MNSKKTFHPNKIIRTLITADTLFWAGAFFNSAIAAVYLADVIKIDPVTVIATGYAVYLLARSLPQFQIAVFHHHKPPLQPLQSSKRRPFFAAPPKPPVSQHNHIDPSQDQIHLADGAA